MPPPRSSKRATPAAVVAGPSSRSSAKRAQEPLGSDDSTVVPGPSSMQTPRNNEHKRRKKDSNISESHHTRSDTIDGPSGSRQRSDARPMPAATIAVMPEGSEVPVALDDTSGTNIMYASGLRGAKLLLQDLDTARAKNQWLTDMLLKESAGQRQRDLKAKQDLMFNEMRCEAKLKMVDDEKARARRHNEILTAQYDLLKKHHMEHVEKLEAKLAEKKDRCADLNEDLLRLQEEAQHQEDRFQMLEEDMEELRKIENEAQAHREALKAREALPPAYTREEELPDSEECEDGGALDVAAVKRAVVGRFDDAVAAALNVSAQTNADPSIIIRETTPAQLFVSLSCALQDAANSFDHIVKQLGTGTTSSRTQQSTVNPWEIKTFTYETRVNVGSMADRIASFFLDLIVKLLAAFELRPITVYRSVPQRMKSKLAMAWTTIDEALVSYFRLAFLNYHGPEGTVASAKERGQRLYQLQIYSTRLKLVQSRLEVFELPELSLRGRVEILGTSTEWITDVVEKERQIFFAMEAVPDAAAAAPVVDAMEVEEQDADEQTARESPFPGQDPRVAGYIEEYEAEQRGPQGYPVHDSTALDWGSSTDGEADDLPYAGGARRKGNLPALERGHVVARA